MKRSGFTVMRKLIGLVKPLTGYMILAIAMGLTGHLCASFITIFGGYAVLNVLGFETPLSLTVLFVSVAVFALLRAVLRYGEQACNHFIAFKLLALIRDKVFQALRRLNLGYRAAGGVLCPHYLSGCHCSPVFHRPVPVYRAVPLESGTAGFDCLSCCGCGSASDYLQIQRGRWNEIPHQSR